METGDSMLRKRNIAKQQFDCRTGITVSSEGSEGQEHEPVLSTPAAAQVSPNRPTSSPVTFASKMTDTGGRGHFENSLTEKECSVTAKTESRKSNVRKRNNNSTPSKNVDEDSEASNLRPAETKNSKDQCSKNSEKEAKSESKRRRNEDELSRKVEERTCRPTKDRKMVHICLILFALVALYSRLLNIEAPSQVCWDETHFGKMGSWYINRTFFFDVHPPLGKMLVALAGYMTGYDGTFPFGRPGDEYGDTKYVGMRVFSAVLGSALVPMSYHCVWLLTHSMLAAIFAASFILFDTGTNTLSRYILLDPPLFFFIMASTCCNLQFLAYRDRPFTGKWWFWMAATGVSMSGAIGVKFVGLFVILLVGLWTIWDLNRLLCDISLPLSQVFRHLLARAVCFIALPAVCYVSFYVVHFKVLSHTGSGDGFFSSAFQSQLIGNTLYNVSMPQNVAFGSIISLKQRRTGGAYLHSHAHLYPEELGPRQQQVTTYSHKDDNNLWKVKPADRDASIEEPVVLVKNGDLVRLEHVVTRRNLHSHKEPAPLSRRHFQVSGYGMNGTGDANDVWLVEVTGVPQGAPVQTIRSHIRFVHYYVRCALSSHDKRLPKWGWEQLEATCSPNNRDQHSAWNVEEVRDPRLPNVSFDIYSPSFKEKFLESHAVMTQANNGMKPREGEISSRPWQWPVNYKGQIFSMKGLRVYLLGNPVLFWSALALKLLFLLVYIVHSVRRKRRVKQHRAMLEYTEKMFTVSWWLLLGWALHYFPFWLMARVLYFHHYFSAYLFSAMFCGVMLDYLVTQLCVHVPEGLTRSAFYWCVGLIMGSIVYSFYLFHPVTYGMKGDLPSAEGGVMYGLKWLDSWDF